MKKVFEPQEIIEKLKSEFSLSGQASEVLLDQIEQSLILIDSVKQTMINDADEVHTDTLTGKEYQIPLGFTRNRLGELKEHPGIKIKKEQEANIQSCLKQLGIKLTTEPGEKEKEKGGVLKSMLGGHSSKAN
ncbi:MAG: hypothetical protein NXI20_17775 [bacterium]|nr:hypothetical protein [bacterium]